MSLRETGNVCWWSVHREMSSGHLRERTGLQQEMKGCCQAKCGAVRTECAEPRAWRHLLSHLPDNLLVTGLPGPPLPSMPKPLRVNIPCLIPGLQSTGHDEFCPHQ